MTEFVDGLIQGYKVGTRDIEEGAVWEDYSDKFEALKELMAQELPEFTSYRAGMVCGYPLGFSRTYREKLVQERKRK